MKPAFLKPILFVGVMVMMHVCQAQDEWPKSITAADGTVINIYQPQTESFTGNILKSRAAISVMEPNSLEPVFGVFWSTSTVGTDRDTREVNIESVKVNNIKI